MNTLDLKAVEGALRLIFAGVDYDLHSVIKDADRYPRLATLFAQLYAENAAS